MVEVPQLVGPHGVRPVDLAQIRGTASRRGVADLGHFVRCRTAPGDGPAAGVDVPPR